MKKPKQLLKQQKGFSLFELLISLSIFTLVFSGIIETECQIFKQTRMIHQKILQSYHDES